MSADLDTLSTDELRQRAFEKAERSHDVGFFWDLVKHMRASQAIAGEDGSSGAITGSISELVHLVRELMGRQPFGEDEPLLRARFLQYLR
ncbi:MAG: hypothetical protein WD794_17525 [Mycobacteriales bacterium]